LSAIVLSDLEGKTAECDYVTFGSLLSVICNVRALYSGGETFGNISSPFCTLAILPTSVQNFTEIVPGKPLHQGC